MDHQKNKKNKTNAQIKRMNFALKYIKTKIRLKYPFLQKKRKEKTSLNISLIILSLFRIL